jgi:hypothetical protein
MKRNPSNQGSRTGCYLQQEIATHLGLHTHPSAGLSTMKGKIKPQDLTMIA